MWENEENILEREREGGDISHISGCEKMKASIYRPKDGSKNKMNNEKNELPDWLGL